ncbi:hypothetical protein I350_05962 [Cryptococcus amylolentus CBS 6273]|uniref:Uncharacterized protein n=1 Tax=Cryptococcus amylolentus CBS 6273 TaxID=1296118 RepID=A0A1E3JSN8_9TREE|nr:hypothetical protein I350_05962 [Cryptococcus amylolentus CBS 6273]
MAAELVINFNPPPPSTPRPALKVAPPATVVTAQTEEPVEDTPETPLVVPATLPPASTRAPSFRAPSAAPSPPTPSIAPVHSGLTPATREELQEGDIEETEVTTATTTRKTVRRRLGPTPSPPIPTDAPVVNQTSQAPRTPEVYQTGTNWVENIPEDEPQAPPPPPASLKPISGQPTNQTPQESMRWPFGRHDPSGGGTLKGQCAADDVDVDTGATTIGRPTLGMPSSAQLGSTSERLSGTKGGLRPIPIIDYMALLQPSISFPVKAPTSTRHSTPARKSSDQKMSSKSKTMDSCKSHPVSLPSPPHPASPQPHPTPPQTTVNVTVGHSPTMHLSVPAPTSAPGTTATMVAPLPGGASVRSRSVPLPGGGTSVHPATVSLPASNPSSKSPSDFALRSSHSHSGMHSQTRSRPRSQMSVAPTVSPAATSNRPAAEAPKTIVTLSAHLDNDTEGNQHLHAKWHDHQATNHLDVDLGKAVEPEETPKDRKRREKKEARAKAKELERTERASRPESVMPPSTMPSMGQGGMSTPYKPVANFPPPKSERYAYPAPVTVIGEQRKKRFDDWFKKDRAPPGLGSMGMGPMGGPLPFPAAQSMYPRPPLSNMGMRPPMFQPPMGYGPGAMGMGMNRAAFEIMFNPMMMGGMGMGGMPMLMGPGVLPGMMMGTPGILPGMPGVGNLPRGYFGRDQLGRDFAGPGGVGSSAPYRPPDPSALPPMPFGLPVPARPGQEGYDQFGRMLPPELPEGFTWWDGWGRPIVAAGANAPPQPLPQQQQQMPLQQGPPMGGSRVAPSHGRSGTSSAMESDAGSGRPDQPACFNRPPAKEDSYYRYEPFEAFSFSAHLLNHPHQLHLPPEIVSRDVNEQDWMKFIEDLAREALSGARHSLMRQARGEHTGPDPLLSESVQSLLASWAVAFFAPRGIRVYAAKNGTKVVPPPIDPPGQRGYTLPSEWSDDDLSSEDDFGYGSEFEEETEARKADMHLPKREREVRKNERLRIRRRERRRTFRLSEVKGTEVRGGWEVHFIPATPTLWQPGMRPQVYGEPKARLRR